MLNRSQDGSLVDDNESNDFPEAKAAVVLYDIGCDWLDAFPKSSKSGKDTKMACQEFAGPTDEIESFYAENAPELKSTARELGWRMPTATPGVPQTNGVVERRVRIVKAGIRCLLQQSGLHKSWWPYACRATCIAHKTEVDPRKADGVSPYYRRHGEHPKHPRIPFGAIVDYMPVPNPNKEPLSTWRKMVW